MQIEVINPKPAVTPPKEYILRVSQDELNLIASLIGRTYGGPNWIFQLYKGLEKHMTKEAENILSDKSCDCDFEYTNFGLKND